ncbi:MAG: ROK family protein [Rhodobacteraceae bacterium]|nr:ROK family protein [Paracoccaceae bacterium]
MRSLNPDPVLPSGVAVDFGGTKIAAARLEHGRIIESERMQTDGDASVAEQIAAIGDLLAGLQLRADEAVGVALSGRVSRDGDWFAVNTDTLSQVVSVPLQEILSDQLGRRVTVQNDAIAAALGEYAFGAGRGSRNMAFVTVSTGVGGGIILNGRPLISDSGLAGHMGFTTTRVSSGTCGSGRRQTVESVASGRAIAAQAAALGHPGLDARAVFEAHLAGAGWASTLIEQSASVVAELSANLKSLLDLERIVLGGSIGTAQGYIDLVRQALSCEPRLFQPEIVPVELGANSALLGVLIDR